MPPPETLIVPHAGAS